MAELTAEELQKFHTEAEDLQAMFNTNGWKWIEARMAEKEKLMVESLIASKEVDEIRRLQGQIEGLRIVTKMTRQMVEASLERKRLDGQNEAEQSATA